MSGSRRLLHLESDVAWRPEALFGASGKSADEAPRSRGTGGTGGTHTQLRLLERRTSETGVGSRARAVALAEWAATEADEMADDEMLSRLLTACHTDHSAGSDRAHKAHAVEHPDPASVPLLRPTLYRELGDDPESHRRPTGPAILHVRVDVDARHEARFLEWYVGVHVPAILDAPGMLSARRFERIPLAEIGGSVAALGLLGALGETDEAEARAFLERRHYFTIYEMEAVDVVGRDATQRCAKRGACPADLEAHRIASNQVYAETARVGTPG